MLVARLLGIGVCFPHFVEGLASLDTQEPFIRVTLSGSISQEQVCWFHHWRTPGDEVHMSAGRRKDGWYSLLVQGARFAVDPSGESIQCEDSTGILDNSTLDLLFYQVIPMVLNLRGTEVLHASSVLTPRGAVAFVGNGGYGKSTLSASLVAAGMPLVSDDAVPLRIRSRGNSAEAWTSNGPPVMGLWPHARRILRGSASQEVGPSKLRVTLSEEQHCQGDFPIQQIYFLRPQKDALGIQALSLATRETVIELTRAAHRLDIEDKPMLRRQLDTLHRVASATCAKVLVYPTKHDPLELRAAVLADLNTLTA